MKKVLGLALAISFTGCAAESLDQRGNKSEDQDSRKEITASDLSDEMMRGDGEMPKRGSIAAFALAMGSRVGDENYDPALDFNRDNVIDVKDYEIFLEATRRQLEGAERTKWNAFISADANKDAVISGEELVQEFVAFINLFGQTADVPQDYDEDGDVDIADVFGLGALIHIMSDEDFAYAMSRIQLYDNTGESLNVLKRTLQLQVAIERAANVIESYDYNRDGELTDEDKDILTEAAKYWYAKYAEADQYDYADVHRRVYLGFANLNDISADNAVAITAGAEAEHNNGKIDDTELEGIYIAVEVVLFGFDRNELEIYRAMMELPATTFEDGIDNSERF